MKKIFWLFSLMFLISLPMAPAATAAGHGYRGHGHGHYSGYYRGPRVGLGFYFGSPWYPSWPAAPYYYGYPSTVIVQPAQPPVYIERGAPQPAPQAEAYWYYCASSRTYYPYVKECPEGWQRVVPTPPAN